MEALASCRAICAGGLELKDQLLLSLIDHICFAIERYEQGIELPYLMLAETKMLYPREFKIGEWAVRQIEFRCGVRLPYYEAGYIALQLASASMSREMRPSGFTADTALLLYTLTASI